MRALKTDRRPFEERMRTLVRLLAGVAVLSLVGAVTVNALWAEASLAPQSPRELAFAADPLAAAAGDKPAVEMLPDRIVSFETITRQHVPGQGERAAEAVYVTLNMNLAAMIAINVYARAESFPSAAEAEDHVRQAMQNFLKRSGDTMVNGLTVVRMGYSEDEGTLAYAWTRDNFAVVVKGMFAESIPAQKKDFLERQALPIAEAIDLFQRTGQEGIGGAAAKTKPQSEAPDTAPGSPADQGLPPVEGENSGGEGAVPPPQSLPPLEEAPAAPAMEGMTEGEGR